MRDPPAPAGCQPASGPRGTRRCDGGAELYVLESDDATSAEPVQYEISILPRKSVEEAKRPPRRTHSMYGRAEGMKIRELLCREPPELASRGDLRALLRGMVEATVAEHR